MFPVEPFWWLGELLPGQYPHSIRMFNGPGIIERVMTALTMPRVPRYLPSYVRKVHSFPHLVLLTGMLANCGLFVQLVFSWKYWEEEEHGPWDYVATCRTVLTSSK